MGGQSGSALAPLPDGSGAVWRGDLITDGGGFCGTRSKRNDMDLRCAGERCEEVWRCEGASEGPQVGKV